MQCARSISPARCTSSARASSKLASRLAWATADQVPANIQMAANTNVGADARPAGQDTSTPAHPSATYWEAEMHRLRVFRPKPSRFLQEALMLQAYVPMSETTARPRGMQ